MTRFASFDITGDDALATYLDGVQRRLTHWQVLEDNVLDFARQRQRDRFDTQGASEGVPWARYGGEPVYQQWKRAQGVEMVVNRWIGGQERLYPAFIEPSHPENVGELRGDGIVYGVTVPYAGRIDEGGENMFGEKAPPRPLAQVGEATAKRFAQLILLYVARDDEANSDWSSGGQGVDV